MGRRANLRALAVPGGRVLRSAQTMMRMLVAARALRPATQHRRNPLCP